MPIQKTQGIVLKKMDFRDSSLIVTLFTRDFGKLKLVVKGVRKEGSTDLVHFELLSCLDIVFYEKSNTELFLLSESSLEDPMLELRNSFRTLAFGCYLAELVDAFFEMHESNLRVYEELRMSLKNLKSVSDRAYWALHFELFILKEAGLTPRFEACVRCGQSASTPFFWSVRQGGVLCKGCSRKEAGAKEIPSEICALVSDFGNRCRDQVPNANYEQAEVLIRNFISVKAECTIRSAEFLTHSDKFLSLSIQDAYGNQKQNHDKNPEKLGNTCHNFPSL